MQCPFLKEAQVDSCSRALTRKPIARAADHAADDRCFSGAFRDCSLFRAAPEVNIAGALHCPYVDQSLSQYCGAAPVTKYIPYSEALLSRCGTSAHTYCDLYISMAHADLPQSPRAGDVPVPQWLWYASNHMWLDADDEDGTCHVGIDGLLATALGSVERVSFFDERGLCRPSVSVTVHGVPVQLVFANPIAVTGVNVYLRATPAKLISDPYRMGWLFEGKRPTDSDPRAGLLSGDQAVPWMEREVDRVSRFVHDQIARADCFVADGGAISTGFTQHLGRDQIIELFHRYFSPWGSLNAR
jgi:glycine cleavage system H lipoate-binding protein